MKAIRKAIQGTGRCGLLGLLLVGWLALMAGDGAAPVLAWDGGPVDGVLQGIGFDQRLGEPIPLDVLFRDEAGQVVTLAEYFHELPVILVMGYFTCPNLCSLVRQGLVESLQPLKFTAGQEFQVVEVSIDPDESSQVAAAVKQPNLWAYGRPGSEGGWHFLVGEEASIRRLAQAVGFRYRYDPEQDQYAHPSGIVLLTPDGRVARYFFGLTYPERDLRLGLMEAATGRIGSPIDQVLLYCYHYDPATGRYSLLIDKVLQVAGLVTVLGLGGLLLVLFQRGGTGGAGFPGMDGDAGQKASPEGVVHGEKAG